MGIRNSSRNISPGCIGRIPFLKLAIQILHSVIVDDFNVESATYFKPKADPPLVIDADAVLSSSITF
jgi:hypothetical protein